MIKKIHYSFLILFSAICFFSSVQAQSPILVRDIRTGSNSSGPYGLLNIGNTLFFGANNGFNGTELYKTDGTTNGTIIVKDINTSSGTGSSCQFFVNLNGTLVFVADNGTNGFEIWKSDGTNLGTAIVADINSGSNDANPTGLTVVGNFVYFTATNGVDGIELWRTDGTSLGTTMVKDLWAGSGNGSPAYLTNVNGTLFFQANDGFNGVELWKSDGTAAGTVMVKDIYLGFNSSNPNSFSNINGTLYFSAETANQGGEIWKSDGTSSGTVLVKDINQGSSSSNPSGFTLSGSNIFFNAFTPSTGYELWKTDGSNAGTILVKDINIGNGSSNLTSPIVVNGQLYFNANDGAFGSELWTSNGTSNGTFMLSDINPGSSSSNPTAMAQYNNVLYFRATTATTGAEMYRSDGTASGTILISDMALGAISSDAGGFVPMNGTLYFPANDGVVGRELFKYTPPPCVPPNPNISVSDATACAGQGNTVSLTLQNSEANTFYQPFFGQTPVGASISGIAGQNVSLTMLCNALNYGNNNIVIKVTKNGCPATQLNDTSIVTITGTQDQNVSVSGGFVCNGNGAEVELGNTQAGVVYQAKINGVLVGSPILSQGGDTTLFIPSLNLSLGLNEVYVNASGTQNCPDLELLDSATVFVSTIPNNATATGAVICGNGSANLIASGAQNNQTYAWYTSSTGGSPIIGQTSSNFVTPNLTTTTNYYVAIVRQNGCESANRTLVTATVSIPPQSTPTITAATDLHICGSGTTSIFIQGASIGDSYRWYNTLNGVVPIAGVTSNSFTTPLLTATTSYYPCIANSLGCEGQRATITVVVESLPNAPSAVGSSLCGNGQATLVASNTSINGSYQWYAGATGANAFLNDTNSIFITPNINVTTTYFVSSISALGCESATRIPAIATVNSLPNDASGNSGARCGPGTVSISASGATFGSSYQWYTSANGNTSISGANSSNYTTPSISATTNYYVTIINTNNCESANRTLVVATINSIPADAGVAGASRCGNGSVTLSANGGQTYNWYTSQSGGNAIIGANSSSYITPNLSVTTIYYVTIIGIGNCESLVRTPVTATINNIPSAPSAVASASICGNGSVALTASPINIGETYQWFSSANGNTAINGAINAIYTTPNINNTTIYYVATISAAGCESNIRTSGTATVNALPLSPVTTNDTICGSGILSLFATSSTSNVSYQWYSSASGNTQIIGATTSSYTTPFLSTTTSYYVSAISALGCESGSREIATAIINNLPAAPVTTGASVCGQGVMTLNASGAANNSSYVWYNAATGSNAISNANNATYTTPILSSTTSYYVSILSADNCESITRTQVIATVNPLPSSPTVTSVSRCGSGTVSIQAAGSNLYAWYSSATGNSIISGVSGSSYITPFLTQNTSYFVSAISALGCESANRTVGNVIINSLPNIPTIIANGSLTFCNGDSISLTANTNVSIQSWSTGSTNAQISVLQSGNYTVTVVDANFCTNTSLPTSVIVNPTPITPVVSAIGNTTVCDGQTVTLTTPVSNAYLWSNGVTTQTNSIINSGSYSVQITNQFGCQSAVSQPISITINPLPVTPTIAASSTIICASNPITLNAPAGFTAYQWSNSQTTQTISTLIPGNYTVTVTDANGCTSNPSTVLNITNIPSPTAPVITANSNTICSGDSIVLNASSGFASYLWNTGEVTSSINISTSGNYIVTGFFCSGSNSLQSVAFNLVVHIVNQATITGSADVCPNSTDTLVASSGASYLWNNGQMSQSIIGSIGNNSVIVTDINGCESTASIIVNQYNVTIPTISGNVPNNLCPGTNILVNSSPAISYLWSDSLTSQTRIITNTGCYTVTATDINGCTASSSPFCVNYLPGVPTPNIVSTDSALCLGETSIVSCNTCPVGGINYLWSNSINSATQTISNAICLNLTISDINGCAATSNSYCITSSQTPANPVISYDNNSGTLTANVVADNYMWFADGLLTQFSTQSIQPINNAIYSVLLSNNNGCISDTSAGFNYLFTGLTNQDILEGFNIYPNPVRDIVTLDIKNSNNVFIQIFDVSGKDVYLNQISNQGHFIHENLDLSSLSDGVYFLKINYNNKVKSLKFVKTN